MLSDWQKRQAASCGCKGTDEYCPCQNIDRSVEPEMSDVEKAYGLLWRTVTDDKKVHEARKLLLGLIGKDGQRRGVKFAQEQHGELTPKELAMLP